MLKQAFEFMQETDRPHVHGEARAKILSLLKEIDAVYKQHVRKPTGMVCDICGKGDTDDIHKVKDVVNGYEHRESMSPRLCYGHSCGWNTSYTKLEYNRRGKLLGLNRKIFTDRIELQRTLFEKPVLLDEEIDLHFAQYLAKQLQKTLKEHT
jgi:hypothetical protein